MACGRVPLTCASGRNPNPAPLITTAMSNSAVEEHGPPGHRWAGPVRGYELEDLICCLDVVLVMRKGTNLRRTRMRTSPL